MFNQWVASDGSKRQKHEVVVETLKMLGGNSDNQNNSLPNPKELEEKEKAKHQTSSASSIDIDEEDIPF